MKTGNQLEECAAIVLQRIVENRDSLLSILTSVETYKTAEDELQRCKNCLKNIHKQHDYFIGGEVNSIAVYLPRNQPLYSFVLFCIIPSFLANEIFVRPPVTLQEVYEQICEVILKGCRFLHISVVNRSRREFLNCEVKKSSFIIFTGKYENAKLVCSTLRRDQSMIFNGSGCNSIIGVDDLVLSDDAMLKIIQAQTYNSGQDCMAPSAIFIPIELKTMFLTKLKAQILKLRLGENRDSTTDIGPLIDTHGVKALIEIFEKEEIVYGGCYNEESGILEPTIIVFNSIDNLPCYELFSPVFCVFFYVSFEEIKSYFEKEWVRRNCSYISLFSRTMTPKFWGNEKVLYNSTIDSIDDGNSEFGGKGIESSFVYSDGKYYLGPVLASREIYRICNISLDKEEENTNSD